MRLPQTHPWMGGSAVVLGYSVLWQENSGGPLSPCPCDWAERASGTGTIKKESPEIDGRASCRWNLGSPCWLTGWLACAPGCNLAQYQSASHPVSQSGGVCGRSVAMSLSLGAARCQAERPESGQLQPAGHTLKLPPPPPMLYARTPMIAMPDAHAGPCHVWLGLRGMWQARASQILSCRSSYPI